MKLRKIKVREFRRLIRVGQRLKRGKYKGSYKLLIDCLRAKFYYQQTMAVMLNPSALFSLLTKSKTKLKTGGIIKPQKDAENILAEKISLTLAGGK